MEPQAWALVEHGPNAKGREFFPIHTSIHWLLYEFRGLTKLFLLPKLKTLQIHIFSRLRALYWVVLVSQGY